MQARSCLAAVVLSVVGFMLPRPVQAQGPLPPPPELERYVSRNKIPEFVKEATIWVERHPEADATPRLLGELHLMGRLNGSKGLEETALAKLVLEHSESITARFVLSTLKDDGAYREFLNRLARDQMADDVPKFAEQFCGAVELGLKHYDQRFYQGDDFLLNVAILSAEADRGMLRRAALAALQNAGGDTRRIVAVAFDDKASDFDKFVRLTEIRSRMARQYQQVFYSRLNEKELADPRVLRVVAENLLTESKYAEALSLLGEIDDGRDPQIIYWQGLCLLAEDRPAEARDLFERTVKLHPKSPWALVAAELAPRCIDRDKQTEAYASALLGVLQRLRTGVGAAEAQIAWHEGGQTSRIYVGLVPADERLEVMISRQDRPLAAYVTHREQCQVYLDGDGAIFRFQDRGAFPLPKAHLVETPEGGVRLATSLEFSDKFSAALEANQALLESPLMTTQAGLAKTLRTLVGASSLPCPIDARDGMRTFVWLAPGIDRPELSRVTYVVSREDMLVSLSCGRFSCERLRYGPRDKVVLTPPAWPRLPVVVKPRFEPVFLMKVLAGATQALQEPATAVQNAALPGETPRR